MDILNYNIFGKKLTDIKTDDVRAFCQKQIREGINLDYKKDFSSTKKIAKTIAAMANTLGGWIIIGVEDTNDRPKLPSEGLDWEKQLPLKVTNLVIDNISPPPLPVVHVCKPDARNKTFVILYVQESESAPHWLFNENKLCVRLADRTSSTEWERLASADEWEYLREKRQRSEEMYKQQKDQLDDLFVEYDLRSEIKHARENNLVVSDVVFHTEQATKDKISITISPKYPTHELLKVEDTLNIIGNIKFRSAYGLGDFPFWDTHFPYKTFQKGAHVYYDDSERERINYFALNQFGMFSFKESIFRSDIKGSGEEVRLDQLLVEFKQSLMLARKLYEKLDYLGVITIESLVEGREWMLLGSSTDTFFATTYKLRAPLAQIYFSVDTSLTELSNESTVTALVQRFYDVIANSFGWEPTSRSKLQQILKPFGI
jgi:hypothetical protein